MCEYLNVFLSTQVSLTVRDEAVDSHEPGHDQRSVWVSSSLKKEKNASTENQQPDRRQSSAAMMMMMFL